MKSFRLALFLFRADRGGRQSVRVLLAFSLALGIAALVALERFAERIEATIRRDSKSLMAADFQVQAWRPFDLRVKSAVEKYRSSGNLVEQTDMVSSARTREGASFTISLRALEGNSYPFYGAWITEPQLKVDDLKSQPTLIIDSSLKGRGIKVGDELSIGRQKFLVKAFLKSEPQTVASAFALGPRIIMNAAWLASTGLLGHGSRAFHELLIRSSLNSKNFKKEFRAQVPDPHWRLITPEHANRQADRILDRIRAFLSYVGLTGLFLGGVGIFVIFRSQFLLKLHQFLTLRCLGARAPSLVIYALLNSLGVGTLGFVLGASLGLWLEHLMTLYALNSLHVALAAASMGRPLLLGGAVAIFVVGLAVLVPMAEVLRVPVAQAIRQDETERHGLSRQDGLAIVLVSFLIVLLVGRSFKTGALFLASLSFLAAALAFLSFVATEFLSRLKTRFSFGLRYALIEFSRRRARSQLLVSCIGIGLFLLSTVLFVGQALRRQLNVADRLGVPNIYFLGVPHESLPELAALVPQLKSLPTSQARLVSIRDKDISTSIAESTKAESAGPSPSESEGDSGSEADTERFFQTREYFITRRSALGEGERLVEGSEIFGAPVEGILRASLEEGFAERMNLKVGESFKVEIAGVALPAIVRSIRHVDWFNMRPNFMMVFAQDDLKDAPMDDVGFSRVLPSQIEALQWKVSQKFPQITTLDGDALGQRLTSLLNQLSLSIFSVSLFTLGSCLFVLTGLTLARRPELIRDLSLWRCLGLDRSRLSKMVIAEALLTGTLASVTSALMSLATLALLCHFVLAIPFELPDPSLVLALVVLPPVLLAGALRLLMHPLLRQRVGELYRQAQEL